MANPAEFRYYNMTQLRWRKNAEGEWYVLQYEPTGSMLQVLDTVTDPSNPTWTYVTALDETVGPGPKPTDPVTPTPQQGQAAP